MPILLPAAKPCPCGSGEPRRELRDAKNIFCAFVCDACEATKRAEFDPRIFTADPYPADEPIEEDRAMTQHAPTPDTPRTGIDPARAAEIAARNDALRRDRLGGHVVMTAAVAALPPDTLNAAILALRRFEAFTPDNDPHGEHDFGAFEQAGERYFFKIDTYAEHTLTSGAEDPLAPNVVRVLTLMLASDY